MGSSVAGASSDSKAGGGGGNEVSSFSAVSSLIGERAGLSSFFTTGSIVGYAKEASSLEPEESPNLPSYPPSATLRT